jgi:hypothetical protein
MMLAARARPPVQRLDGNKSICILPKAAMKPCQKQAARDFDYDGLAWVIATVYATTISVLPSPVELKPASVQCGSEAAPRTGFQRGMELGRSARLPDASPGSVLLGRPQVCSLITRKILASSMAYLRRQARATCA